MNINCTSEIHVSSKRAEGCRIATSSGVVGQLSLIGVVGQLSLIGVVGQLSLIGVVGQLSLIVVVRQLSLIGVVGQLSLIGVVIVDAARQQGPAVIDVALL